MGVPITATGGVTIPGVTYETMDGRDALCLSLLPNNMALLSVDGHGHDVKYTEKGFYWDVNRNQRNQLWRLKGAL